MKRLTVKQAIDAFGSVRKLANAIDVSPQAIYEWRVRKLKYVPEPSLKRIAEVRPDLVAKSAA